MADAVIEVGRNAHGELVEKGRYVKAPDGRIVLLQPHLPMKPGWALATPEEIDAAALRGRAAGIPGELAAGEALRDALEASEIKGEHEREEAEANAARAAEKAAKVPQTPIGMSEEEYQARKGALASVQASEPVEPPSDAQYGASGFESRIRTIGDADRNGRHERRRL